MRVFVEKPADAQLEELLRWLSNPLQIHWLTAKVPCNSELSCFGLQPGVRAGRPKLAAGLLPLVKRVNDIAPGIGTERIRPRMTR